MAEEYFQSVHTGTQIDNAISRIVNGELDKLANDAIAAGNSAQDALDGITEAINNIPAGSTPIVNDLTTGGKTSALSAQQGVVLKGMIGVDWFGKGEEIPEYAKIDNYRTPGKYDSRRSSITETLSGIPQEVIDQGRNFTLFVFRRTADVTMLNQLMITNAGEMYIRGCDSGSSTPFRSWRSILDDTSFLSKYAELKPSGVYPGSGSAATNTIAITTEYTDASVLSITETAYGNSCIIGRNGGFCISQTGELVSIPGSVARFSGGQLTTNTDAIYINAKRNYNYEVL